MTDAELLAHKKIGPAVAAKYLQNGSNAHDASIKSILWCGYYQTVLYAILS